MWEMEFGGENEEKKKSIDFQICVANTIYNTYTPTYTDILHIISNIWIAIQLRLIWILNWRQISLISITVVCSFGVCEGWKYL